METKQFNLELGSKGIGYEFTKKLINNRADYTLGFVTPLEYLQFIVTAINSDVDAPNEDAAAIRDFIFDKVGDVVNMFDINIKI
jgi:hypothetical protein